MTYAINFKNKPVIEASPLSVMLDGVDLTDSVEEYRELLRKYHIEFDERYVWD